MRLGFLQRNRVRRHGPAWQQRCRDLKKKVSLMTFRRTSSRWDRLLLYNETFGEGGDKNNDLMLLASSSAGRSELLFCLVYLVMLTLNWCLRMTNGCTWNWRVIYRKVRTEKKGNAYSKQSHLITVRWGKKPASWRLLARNKRGHWHRVYKIKGLIWMCYILWLYWWITADYADEYDGLWDFRDPFLNINDAHEGSNYYNRGVA